MSENHLHYNQVQNPLQQMILRKDIPAILFLFALIITQMLYQSFFYIFSFPQYNMCEYIITEDFSMDKYIYDDTNGLWYEMAEKEILFT